MTEDYVSFETAKQLKTKGFDVPCEYFYSYGKLVKSQGFDCNWNKGESLYTDYKNECSAPTLQMAMKWLREVHNIFICILPYEVGAGVMDYTYVLYKIDAKNFYFENLSIQGRAKNISEISYEKTVEAAIKCCLENLI